MAYQPQTVYLTLHRNDHFFGLVFDEHYLLHIYQFLSELLSSISDTKPPSSTDTYATPFPHTHVITCNIIRRA